MREGEEGKNEGEGGREEEEEGEMRREVKGGWRQPGRMKEEGG